MTKLVGEISLKTPTKHVADFTSSGLHWDALMKQVPQCQDVLCGDVYI